jgi:hypothetical protein
MDDPPDRLIFGCSEKVGVVQRRQLLTANLFILAVAIRARSLAR